MKSNDRLKIRALVALVVAAACAALAVAGVLAPVQAQTPGQPSTPGAAPGFPTQPVKIVVPFPPGGTTDILARQLANELTQMWRQPVLVENRAGASGTIFSGQLVRMAPDGHTLMLTATHHVINPGLYKTLKYDTRTDFTSIAQVAAVPNVLVVNPMFAARSAADLVTMARARPGEINFGSSGTGGANHLAGELFKSVAGIDMVHIAYKGAAPALNDLLGGQIPVMFDSVPGVLAQIQAGKLRALAVTSLTRSPVLPSVPTLDEEGFKGFDATAWFGLYGPPAMKADLLARIATDVRVALNSAQVKAAFEQQGAVPGTMTQPQFAAFVDAEITKWSKVINDAKIKVD